MRGDDDPLNESRGFEKLSGISGTAGSLLRKRSDGRVMDLMRYPGNATPAADDSNASKEQVSNAQTPFLRTGTIARRYR